MSDTSGGGGADDGYYGFAGLTEGNNRFNGHDFAIRQHAQRMRTGMVVKVMKVHGGGVDGPPTIDVMPMVKQIDGQGNPTDHGMIYGIPITRNQGGASTIINDPIVGDIGTMAVQDRDISKLKNTSDFSNPDSFRQHHPSDAIYHGPTLNKTKLKQYMMFTNGTGITIQDENGNSIKMTKDGINLNGLIIDKNGNLTTPGAIQAGTGTSDSVTLQNHLHPNTQKPTPGT